MPGMTHIYKCTHSIFYDRSIQAGFFLPLAGEKVIQTFNCMNIEAEKVGREYYYTEKS